MIQLRNYNPTNTTKNLISSTKELASASWPSITSRRFTLISAYGLINAEKQI
jgi:hypothetical protein